MTRARENHEPDEPAPHRQDGEIALVAAQETVLPGNLNPPRTQPKLPEGRAELPAVAEDGGVSAPSESRSPPDTAATIEQGREPDDGPPDSQDNDCQDQFANVRLPPVERDCVETNPLTLSAVLQSVADSYPLLDVALAELATADGKRLTSWGSFDSVFSGYTISKPLGFYENYQNGVQLSRPLWNGGEVYGGYRLGRGVFEPWYLERQPNEGGEFKTGVKSPLLQGYAVDGRRTAVRTAQLERQRLVPDIRARIIAIQLAATKMYWQWVAAGQVIRTQERLLELAAQRNENLIKQVEAGDLPKLTEIDNGRFIATRQVKVVESRRKVQEAAIKLSLFYRDASGQPVVATQEQLPCRFPRPEFIEPAAVEASIAIALTQRPELRELDFQRRQAEVELCYAQNQTLPKLDAYAEVGEDVGEPTSSLRDKSELVLEVGLLAEVPLQRRAALGKIQAARGKLEQIRAKRRFLEDQIRSQVQDAVSAVNNAYEQAQQAQENLRLTEQSLRLGRLSFEEGDIGIIALNIYETSLAEAELLLINAELSCIAALAEYRAALATDLSATSSADVPPSDPPAPAAEPAPEPPAPRCGP